MSRVLLTSRRRYEGYRISMALNAKHLICVIVLITTNESRNLTDNTVAGITPCLRANYYIGSETKRIDVQEVTSLKSTFCVLELNSDPGTQISLSIRYVPHDTKTTNRYHDYVHIGNDGKRINEASMTSYRFANGSFQEEIVSRQNYLWIVFKMSSLPEVFHINVFSSVRVPCNSSMFECSPLQCVNRHAICDGKRDCDNARDEFCHKIPPRDSPCFLCSDGVCIRPQIPRYSLDYGKTLWYLCDGVRHCPDGTDERKDICYRIRGKKLGTISCIPNDITYHHSNPVMMWNNVVCNGERDCYHGEDESEDLCPTNVDDDVFQINPGAVVFATVFLVAVVAVAVAIFMYGRRNGRRGDVGPSQGYPTSSTDFSQSEPELRVPLQSEIETMVFDTVALRQTTL
ncbi:uncharacterized protein LOC124259417 isoform X1 [Haliotis rubra]|uniref:uncharacterized protein LOC124259417 isoform X1 n=1 Tax=Haliotis rubra TaxID=36100 RepID=UPI001EE5A2E9|nr:uncharacterized protein LOC124259417 isoform X1 [Haliotis rubra]